MKPMTFEEWRELWKAKGPEPYKSVWEDARKGMIPEDEAVRIPPVKEWPHYVDGIAVCFMYKHEWEEQDCWSQIKFIPRPVPAWTPKDWEPVIFAKPEDDTILHGVYFKGEIHYDDLHYSARGMRYAKFDASNLGLKWEEI